MLVPLVVFVDSQLDFALADIDRDGDSDAFVRGSFGTPLTYLPNVGSETILFPPDPSLGNLTVPRFAAEFTTNATLPFGLANPPSVGSPTFVDIDGDGDLDAFTDPQFGTIAFLRNRTFSGSPTPPAPDGGGSGSGGFTPPTEPLEGRGSFDRDRAQQHEQRGDKQRCYG